MFNILALLIVVFLTSVFGVVVGSNSFINIPMMILLLGIPAKQAVATNMFCLIFLSLSGGVKFYRDRKLNLKLLLPLSLITLISSLLGAVLVIRIPDRTMMLIITILMIPFSLLLFVQKETYSHPEPEQISHWRGFFGYVATFVLGIYGGFLSAGYVTMLTLAYINIFRLSLLDAVGITKFINLVSSLVAVVVFAKAGLIDYGMSIPLAISMSLGAWVGASLAIRKGHRLIRNMFIIVMIILALRLLHSLS